MGPKDANQIDERAFSGRAFAAAVIVIGLGWLAATFATFSPLISETPRSEGLLFMIAVAAFVPAGVAAAWLSHGLAFRELLLASVVVAGATLLYGQFGLTINPLAQPQPVHSIDQLAVMSHAPGSAYLGPIWARDIVCLALFGFLQAITTASLAFMFRSPTRLIDLASAFEGFLSQRYLSAKRRDARVSKTALIAALGVSLGVAALIAVSSAMSGYQAEVKEKILDTNAHLIVMKWGRQFEDYDEVGQKLRSVSGVVATAPFVFTGGMIASAQGMFPVLVKGVDADQAGGVSNLRAQLQNTDLALLRPAKPGDLPRLFVGVELIKQLGSKVGDPVSLISPVAIEGKRGAPPKRQVFTLAGVFSSGMNEFDQKLVYIGLDAAQRFVGAEHDVSGIEIRTTDPEQVEEMANKVNRLLGGWPYRTTDWRQMNHGIFSALEMQKLMMIVILVFIMVVAAFNIASTLFMLVVEKTRDVAVLKALGARDNMIMKSFVFEGHMISLFGVVVGVLLGLVLSWGLGSLHIHIASDVYLVDHLRVVVKPLEVVIIVLGALEVAHLATLYPALRASRTYPVEALRYG